MAKESPRNVVDPRETGTQEYKVSKGIKITELISRYTSWKTLFTPLLLNSIVKYANTKAYKYRVVLLPLHVTSNYRNMLRSNKPHIRPLILQIVNSFLNNSLNAFLIYEST